MIDIGAEQLIALRDVPRRLPPRPNGRPVHISAIYRWVQRGAHGVRLESIRIGGTTYTSEEALQRFGDRQSKGPAQKADVPLTASVTRQKQIERATKEVEAILGSRPAAGSPMANNR